MKIPLGVNFIEFYKAAKLKGVSIVSRYKGVYVQVGSRKQISWVARVQNDLDIKNFLFPFTEEGELLAAKKYEAYKERVQEQRTIRSKTESGLLTQIGIWRDRGYEAEGGKRLVGNRFTILMKKVQ